MEADTASPAEVHQQPEELGTLSPTFLSWSSATMLLSFAVALLGISCEDPCLGCRYDRFKLM